MIDWEKCFLESSVLGQSTNKLCPSEVIKRCIELAYSDMMTAGRYYSTSFLNSKDEICFAVNRAIELISVALLGSKSMYVLEYLPLI